MKQLKISFILCCLCLTVGLHAQDTAAVSTPKSRMTVLKTNIFSPISLGIERGFGKHFSLSVNGLYFPSMSYGAAADATGYFSLADPSTGFSAEARYYTSKKKAPMNGFYVGGYYLFRIVDVFAHKIVKTPEVTADLKIYIPSDLTTYGVMIGGQRIRSKGFTTDINVGVGYYSLGNIPTVDSQTSEAFKALSQLSKLKSGIGPRLTLSLGHAF
ncbi:MAG: DUF3575 domain-containing protein [Saprospiraceae bacterium]|nr:DUF3575 domain-containing protein [Saprospiraceae bacterium]